MAKRVVEELIPNLESEGDELANEDVSTFNDQQLADCIESRRRAVEKWKGVYWDEFIPFAHGVRHLATYYNDAVHPKDPFEFVGLLKGQAMISTLRNQQMMVLAEYLQGQPGLLENIKSRMTKSKKNIDQWRMVEETILQHPTGKKFLEEFQVLLDKYMDVTYGKERINKKPAEILKTILEMATSLDPSKFRDEDRKQITHFEKKLYKAVGKNRHDEAKEVLTLGRLSWRLRDDDNLLLGRIESQFMRALTEGTGRLESAGRLEGNKVANEKSADMVITALRNPKSGKVTLPAEKPKQSNQIKKNRHSKPRQLIGQPASPGLISGQVRIIQTSSDLGEFKAGEILICDAIQPNMTHLVPLAGAIVERRGGMLIHGAIIAREMGIPCVNGVADVTNVLEKGDLVTVDGYLGIVTIGAAEFDLENYYNEI